DSRRPGLSQTLVGTDSRELICASFFGVAGVLRRTLTEYPLKTSSPAKWPVRRFKLKAEWGSVRSQNFQLNYDMQL
ncbi:hypothetical protein KA005_55540, partial [bacterium]|nr:hypothetical protein [bacterium]